MTPSEFVWLIGSALVGACIGSFLNVVIYRSPRGLSIVTPGSRCPKCGRPIRWYDNIPIVSYILLRGRCRDCGVVVSPRYLIVESLTSVMWLAAAWRNIVHPIDGQPDLVRFFAHSTLFSSLIACTFVDIDWMIIPDRLTVPLMVGGILVGSFFPSMFLSPVPGMPVTLSSWSPAGQFWYAVLTVLLAVGLFIWIRHLLRLMRWPGFVGPADWVLAAVWFVLVVQMGGTIVLELADAGPPAIWGRFSTFAGFWSGIVGLLGGAAPVWLSRLAGNGYLRLKRALLAWRARQWWRARQRINARHRRGRMQTHAFPSSGYVWRVIWRGVPGDRSWISLSPWIAREALGFGDVTLMAAVGAVTGWLPAVLAFFLSPFFAIGFSLVRLIMFGEREIPLGPFLAAATVVVVLGWPTALQIVQPRLDALVLIGRALLLGGG